MWYPDSTTASLREHAQLRTLYACFAASVALHALAMVAFPGLRQADRSTETRTLDALFAPGAQRAESIAPAPPPRRPRERREPETPLPQPIEPAPVAAPSAEEPSPVATPSPQPAAAPSVASSAPEPAPPPSLPTTDASLLEAYRLALIDAARRYKRYPAQAMERGWEGRVEIRIVVGANGMIKSALVKRSSRYQVLDDQALDMVRRAFNALTQDKPAPRGREFTVDVPVIFELQTG